MITPGDIVMGIISAFIVYLFLAKGLAESQTREEEDKDEYNFK